MLDLELDDFIESDTNTLFSKPELYEMNDVDETNHVFFQIS